MREATLNQLARVEILGGQGKSRAADHLLEEIATRFAQMKMDWHAQNVIKMITQIDDKNSKLHDS